MDVLKQKLNDIGSCIGYPFYFFEDGSFSHTFVCGKMNACLVVKGAFAESDKCFFASSEVASMSGIKAMEKSWATVSDASGKAICFKKYLNDIGAVLNYPFYVFDDGAYAKTATLGSNRRSYTLNSLLLRLRVRALSFLQIVEKFCNLMRT